LCRRRRRFVCVRFKLNSNQTQTGANAREVFREAL